MLTIQEKALCVLWYHKWKLPTALQHKFRNEFGQDPRHPNSIKRFFKNFNQRISKNTLCFLLNGQHALYFVANLRLYQK